jgi:hypothetical protein
MTQFDDVCCARLPREVLPLLASLRAETNVNAAIDGEQAWLRWEAGNARVVEVVLPIPGIELYRACTGQWYRFGHSLPDFAFPSLEFRPLAHVVFPDRVNPTPPGAATWQPIRLTLRRDDKPRETTALRCGLGAFIDWSDTVSSTRLSALRGACLHQVLLVVGENLPLLRGTRFWGKDVLVPIGYAPEPSLPESAIRAAACVPDEAIMIWSSDGTETIGRDLLTPLTRANLRLAAFGERP